MRRPPVPYARAIPSGMTAAHDVRIDGPHGVFRAALALPTGPGPHPGVVVLHEVYGLNDDMRRIAARFAAEGYVAVVPDLYSRGNKLVCLTRVLTDASGDRGTLDDIEAARRHLADRPDVATDRIGVAGFCLGGGFALLFAARGGARAASVNYGRVPKRRERLADLCPVVAGYGADDRVFRADASRLEAHLDALGVPHDVKVYEGVGHSFMSYDNGPAWMQRVPSPMSVGYDEAAAEDNWRRILAFFAEHMP